MPRDADAFDPRDLNRATAARYGGRLEAHGPGVLALGWGRDAWQVARFHAVLHALRPSDLAGRELLDVGCGLGDLLGFLREQGLAPSAYVGLDITPGFLDVAGARYPEARLELRDLVAEPFAEPVADTGVVLGVLNWEHPDAWTHLEAMVQAAFAAVRGALLVNLISDVHNEDYPREPFIHYYDPPEVLRLGQRLTPFCTLVHDYRAEPQHELMLVLRHEPYPVG